MNRPSNASWSPDGRIVRPLTDFSNRRGQLSYESLVTDGKYVYFPSVADIADLWVMDVAWKK